MFYPLKKRGPGYITAGRNIAFGTAFLFLKVVAKEATRAPKNGVCWSMRTHLHTPRIISTPPNLLSAVPNHKQIHISLPHRFNGAATKLVNWKITSQGPKQQDRCNNQGLYTKFIVSPHSLKAWSRVSNKIYPTFFCPVLYNTCISSSYLCMTAHK